MPSQRTYKELKGFRRGEFNVGYAAAFLIGRRKDTGLWEVVNHGEFASTNQSMQFMQHAANRDYPAIPYTWLGAMSDEAIKLAFQKDQQKETA